MIIKIKELCRVSYIYKEEAETNHKVFAIREVHYETNKPTLKEAFQEYESDKFDSNKIIYCNDEFMGECLDVEKCISVEEMEEV